MKKKEETQKKEIDKKDRKIISFVFLKNFFCLKKKNIFF